MAIVDMTEWCDRVRIDYTASVPLDARRAILSSVRTILGTHGLYHREHFDRASGAWSIEVTTHDPDAVHPITDRQVADYLKSVAGEYSLTLAQLIDAAREIASNKS